MSKRKRVVRNKSIKTISDEKSEFILRIFYVILISYLVFSIFFEPKTFGNDIRYDVFVFWIPTILGMILTSRFSFVKDFWNDLYIDTTEKIHKKILASFFILLCWFIFSYLTFGLIASITWNSFNKIIADNNKVELYNLPIEKFSRTTGKGGSNKILFQFKNNTEEIKISFDDIKPYLDKNPNLYRLQLKIKKGIWNYYILEDWYLYP
jgi:hypothetical protein